MSELVGQNLDPIIFSPLCDDALEELNHLSDRFELEKVYIDKKGNDKWFLKYNYHIPVFHFEGEYLMKHRADVPLLVTGLHLYIFDIIRRIFSFFISLHVDPIDRVETDSV